MTQIVSAQPAQVIAMQKLLKQTWKDTYGDHLSSETLVEIYKKWQSIEFLLRQIKNRSMYFPLVFEGKELVGLATAHQVKNCLILFRLFVDSKCQQMGIGKRLLDEVITHFPKASKIQLYVETLNQPARNFYIKHGFKEVKRESEKIANQVVEQILLEKNLKLA